MFKLPAELDDEELKKQLFMHSRRKFNDDDVALIKEITSEEFDPAEFRGTLLSFGDCIRNTRYGAQDFIKAVQFCSYKAGGDTNMAAYRKTFPERIARKPNKNTQHASAHRYAQNQLVQSILKRSRIPDHILFEDYRYRAYNKLMDIIDHPDSTPRARIDACATLLTNTKPPEESKLTLDIGFNNNHISDLEDRLDELAKKQIEMVNNGQHTAKDIVAAEIIKKGEQETE